MKWIILFEQWLTKTYEQFHEFIVRLVNNRTPKKIRALANKTKKSVHHKKNEAQSALNKTKKNIFAPTFSFFKNFGYHFSKFRQKLNGGLDYLGSLYNNRKSKTLKEYTLVILSFLFLPIMTKIKDWIISLKPITLAIGISLTTLLTLTALNIYTTQQRAQEERSRVPASTQDGMELDVVRKEDRPVYYKRHKRFFKVLNIDIPIYIESVQSMRNLKLDFVIVSSNRYTREFFYQNEHLVRDRINTMIEPTVPNMPLNNEGRQIIRDKIQVELNGLLKELQIDGHIEDVYVHSILGT